MTRTPSIPSEPVLIDSIHSISSLTESFSENKHSTRWKTLISQPQTRTDSFAAGLASCPPNGEWPAHRHAESEIYFALLGEATVMVDQQSFVLRPGSLLYIPGCATHSLFNFGEGEFRWLYFFAKSSFGDIVYQFPKPQDVDAKRRDRALEQTKRILRSKL